jgi:hypothetical protein
MVKTRSNEHAQINIDKLKDAINGIFGKQMTIRTVTETVDAFGQLSARSTTDTLFIGDLQYGLALDEQLLKSGFVEHGDGVLYIYPTALTTDPTEQDIIIEGNTSEAGTYTSWEVIEQIESPELGGVNCHKSFRCKKRDDVTVT